MGTLAEEGIASWWIPRQRLKESSKTVQKGLELLVEQERIVKTTNQDGETIYKYLSQNTDDYH